MVNVPDFDSLPPVEGQPQGNTWGFWGEDDQLGTLNLLTAQTILAAKEEIKLGKSVSLDLPLNALTTLIADRETFKQEIKDFRFLSMGIYGHDDVLHINTQSSSQWDGLRHVALQDSGLYYNGLKHDDIRPNKDGRNGTHSRSSQISDGTLSWLFDAPDNTFFAEWVENGSIVGRGVLLDYARWRSDTGQPPAKPTISFPITVDELEAVAKHQGTVFKQGDILIIRSGFTVWHNSASDAEREEVMNRGEFIGVEASMKSVKWLWNHHFAALAGDSVGWECCPAHFGEKGVVVLHEWIIDHWGSPLGELWNLEQLAKVCEEQKRWSFFFTSAPLHVFGGVASPPNALAIL